uniref:Uncharacterized protein n=1 Tax=Aegilops tauschii subsp. strangulata TaxID=200361 RepID=A0A453I404_AEGTS
RNCIAVLMGIATTTIRRNCIAGSEPISRGLWQGAVVVRVLGERHAQDLWINKLEEAVVWCSP